MYGWKRPAKGTGAEYHWVQGLQGFMQGLGPEYSFSETSSGKNRGTVKWKPDLCRGSKYSVVGYVGSWYWWYAGFREEYDD